MFHRVLFSTRATTRVLCLSPRWIEFRSYSKNLILVLSFFSRVKEIIVVCRFLLSSLLENLASNKIKKPTFDYFLYAMKILLVVSRILLRRIHQRQKKA